MLADGHDIVRDFRAARAKIGLVPQELSTDMFETVWATVTLQPRPVRQAAQPGVHREGAARPVAVGQEGQQDHDALGRHEAPRPDRQGAVARAQILFLDEPTAGVDVELRRDMWQMVRKLRDSGVTIILTTHYIEEAEEMADRIGVISKGELILVEDKTALMRKLGKKQLTLHLQSPLAAIPAALAGLPLELVEDGNELVYTFDTQASRDRHRRAAAQLDELASSSRI